VERSSGALRIRRTVIGTPHGVSNEEGIEAITEKVVGLARVVGSVLGPFQKSKSVFN
jgi:hypothetical protein